MPIYTDQEKRAKEKAKFMLWALLFAYMIFYILMIVQQRSLMYFPDVNHYVPAESSMPAMKEVEVTTADGLKITHWYQKAKEGKQTFVMFHGNGGNIAHRTSKMRTYSDLGYGIMLCEYRGYGGNHGTPSEDGFYNDGRSCIDYLLRLGVKEEEMIIYGESIGSGVAVQMATEYKNAAIILEVPFDSLARVAQSKFMILPFASFFIHDKFENYKKMDKVNSPVIIIAAEYDKVVPNRFAKSLYEHTPEPKQFIMMEQAGHNNIYDIHGKNLQIIVPKILDKYGLH